MQRFQILMVLLVFLSFNAAGLAASINSTDSCSNEREALVSLNATGGGHAGMPGYYGNQVCVKGAKEFTVRDSCNPSEIKVFSMFSQNNTHITDFSSYTWEVCSKDTRGSIKNSCDSNETFAFSVYQDNNTHVGGKGHFSQSLCLFKDRPENITVSLDGLSGDFRADGSSISTGETIRIAEFPYIVANDADDNNVIGLVSHDGFVKLSRPESGKISMTQTESTFLLPHTRGGHQDIEDEQDEVLGNSFLDLLDPSFGFFLPDQPTVQVALEPDEDVTGFDNTLRGDIEISMQNQGIRNGNLTIKISGD